MRHTRTTVLLILLVTLSASCYGMYNTRTGRFLQRDPIGTDPAGTETNQFKPSNQYADGLNLYEYVDSSPTMFIDPSGLVWIVARDGSPSALVGNFAFASTIEELADKIGLEASQFRKWLTLVDDPIDTSRGKQTLSSLLVTDKICPDQKVKIPNTVIAYWGGWGDSDPLWGAIGKHFVDWGTDVSQLKDRGFHVAELEGLTGAGIEGEIAAFQAQKRLHGIFAWGHGGYSSFVTVESQNGNPVYVTRYGNWEPYYRMALGIIWACHSGDGGAEVHFSSNPAHIFQGHVGLLVPLPFHLYGPTVSSIVPAGAQSTRR